MKKARKTGWFHWAVLAVLLLLAVWAMLLAGLHMYDALDAVHPRRPRTMWGTFRSGAGLHEGIPRPSMAGSAWWCAGGGEMRRMAA